MPIILERRTNIKGNYTAAEKEMLSRMIASFRLMAADYDPKLNILNMQKLSYSDEQIISFLQQCVDDLNIGVPPTKFSIFQFYTKGYIGLVVEGGVVFSLLSMGLLQTKNQVNYNDAGLSVNLFDKAGLYQSWYGVLMQDYLQKKQQFKSTVTASSANAGFIGIDSEFSYQGFYTGYEF